MSDGIAAKGPDEQVSGQSLQKSSFALCQPKGKGGSCDQGFDLCYNGWRRAKSTFGSTCAGQSAEGKCEPNIGRSSELRTD